jgi:cytochrome c553
MITQRFSKKLSVSISAVVISIACLMAGAVEIQALKAKDLRDHPAAKQDAAECLRCHADQKTINMMRLKEGGTQYLFNSAGEFKDSKYQSLTANYHHKTSAAGLPPAK